MKLKKNISKNMLILSFSMAAIILVIFTIVQILLEQQRAREDAAGMFIRIEQILEENQKDLEEVREDYASTCLHNAEAIAFMIQKDPSILDSREKLLDIADMVEVDEIHVFDKTGTIFTGTHPEYYGLTFDSGEQIGFFRPLLEDKSLKLVQDITPNTAEEKKMQYSALWSRNGEFIVQVGMEPVNVMKATKKNELSYIFSLLRVTIGAEYYAIDMNTGEILGSTVKGDLGKNLSEIGFDLKTIEKRGKGFHEKVNGKTYYCVFKQIGENYIGRIVENQVVYGRIPTTMMGLALCLVVIAAFLVAAVTWYMDKYVINGIYSVNDKLRQITEGDLDQKVDVNYSVEFSELSRHINELIESRLANTEKISYVLNKTNINVGVYEYSAKMKTVRFTEHVPEIIAFDEYEHSKYTSEYKIFEKYINILKANPLDKEEGVYAVPGSDKRFVRIEEIKKNNDVMGIVMDVSDEINKLRQAESDRDTDALTGIYNRRGFETRIKELLCDVEALKHSVLIMIDADGLKDINDTYGHDSGDVYLKKIAAVINSFGVRDSLVGRYGGDEFVLFLYHYDTDEELEKDLIIFNYLQDNSIVNLGEKINVPLSFSYGVCKLDDSGQYEAMMKIADEIMYENKKKRKMER